MTGWFLMSAAAVGVLAVAATADVNVTPAFAQGASVTIGPGGVTVRERTHRHRHHRHYREHYARDCKVTTVRHRRADGTVVVRKKRTCY